MIRKFWRKLFRQENITYLALWGLLYIAPLLSMYVRMAHDPSLVFNWTEVFLVWQKFSVFLLFFVLHNILLAPLLILKHKRVRYFSFVLIVLMTFAIYQCTSKPEEGIRSPYIGNPNQDIKRERFSPPPIVGEHDILSVIMLMLMFVANIGIKGYYHSHDERKRLAELKRENAEQQLKYLRYQVNPHFFMNTLNNIHARVDIEPEKAKDTILELSKMMRFVLYEGNKQGVSLSREIDFIRHYVTLMQLRYTDKVRINIALPTEVPDRQIPPLVLITFIENAFKHGISYQRESFVEVAMAVKNESLHFTCTNSKADPPNEAKGGVGLANVRKRLNLLYNQDYALRIHNDADVYTVELNIPLL